MYNYTNVTDRKIDFDNSETSGSGQLKIKLQI